MHNKINKNCKNEKLLTEILSYFCSESITSSSSKEKIIKILYKNIGTSTLAMVVAMTIPKQDYNSVLLFVYAPMNKK